MTPKLRNLGIKLDASTTARLERFTERTGIEAVTLGRKAIEACLDFFDAHQYIEFPLRLMPASDRPTRRDQLAMAAEDPGQYRGGKRSGEQH